MTPVKQKTILPVLVKARMTCVGCGREHGTGKTHCRRCIEASFRTR
jgi:hypothetical protein